MTRKAFLRVLAVGAACVGLASGCATSEEEEQRGTKVLVIGNSFSVTCLAHLPQVAQEAGVELDLASLYIGGCSLERHWKNAQRDGDKDFKPYRFGRNRFGEFEESKINLPDALRLAKWDIVTIQQASPESWRPETYEYGLKLIALIRRLAPTAKICMQETWSYTPWDKRLAKWGLTPDEMYERVHEAVTEFAKEQMLDVIPFGTAIQEWRRRLPVEYGENSFGGDVVGGRRQAERDRFKRGADNKWVPNCDVFHLNERGEYFQALVWAACLLNVDPGNVEYRPDFVSERDFELMKAIATEYRE